MMNVTYYRLHFRNFTTILFKRFILQWVPTAKTKAKEKGFCLRFPLVKGEFFLTTVAKCSFVGGGQYKAPYAILLIGRYTIEVN